MPVVTLMAGSLKSKWLADQRYRALEQAWHDIDQYIEIVCSRSRLHLSPGLVTPKEQEMAVAA